MMRAVKFKVWWRQYKPGDVAEFEHGLANTLVTYHRADYVPDELVVAGVADEVPNKAVKVEAVTRKRGRKAK